MKSLKDALNQYRPLSAEASQQFNQVRGFSTIAVVLCHAYLIFLYPIYPTIMLPIYLLAHACVMALFALSGFLICQSACNNIQQNGQFIIQKYVKARINRIVPPLYSACGFLLLLYWLSPFVFASGNREFTIISDTMSQANMSLNTESILGVLFFVNGFITETPASNFAFWSLSFEAWFYILFGLLLLPNRKMGTSFALLCLIILSTLNYVFLLYVCIWIAGAISALL
ncbi:MAG: acyltransferase family protein, partial [Wohlfahrtiimonas sp.]